MNALILAAVFGVIMMFSGIVLKKNAAIRGLGITGMILVVVANILEMQGITFFQINTTNMLYFDRFALLFNSIALIATLIFFILSSRDMEKVGVHYAEYFALIFFIMAGVVLVTSFKSLLIL
ncbi:MAG TPA: NADH-quinone oxidoreductase subunit N, partial [Chitinophagaceae bacterium]|nr:NADH-quinone oxidoreductase subunit N [Chitinophagaceae bacterium]